jgi:CBS domain-containing protein
MTVHPPVQALSPRRQAGEVMTSQVVTVPPGTPFKELVRLLRHHRIGAIPVVGDDGRVLGIVSEADLILKRQLPPLTRPTATAGAPAHPGNVYAKADGRQAADLMSSPVVTVGPRAELARIAELLHSRRIRHVPVVGEDGRLLGMVSVNDLLDTYLVDDIELERAIRDQVLNARPGLLAEAIDVEVTDGVATLTGRVADDGQATAIVNAVATFDGVVGVANRLLAGPVPEGGAR